MDNDKTPELDMTSKITDATSPTIGAVLFDLLSKEAQPGEHIAQVARRIINERNTALECMDDDRTEPVAPWTPIHVAKANEQRSAISLQMDRAIAAGEWQQVADLAHAMSSLARDINGMYGR